MAEAAGNDGAGSPAPGADALAALEARVAQLEKNLARLSGTVGRMRDGLVEMVGVTAQANGIHKEFFAPLKGEDGGGGK